MIGWLLVLSFVLGFVLTGLSMIRSVTRTVTPVPARPDPRPRVTVSASPRPVEEDDLREPAPVTRGGPRARVEFEDGDVYER